MWRGVDMEGSNRAADRSTVALIALALSRQATVLILVIAAAFWGIAFFLWGQVGLDKWLLLSQEGLRSNDVVVALAQLASKYGMSMIVLVYLLYFLAAFKYEELRDAYPVYLLVLLMFGIAGIGGDVLKEILNRPRPFVEYAGQITAFSTAATPAFPSGHATKSTALALPFLLLMPGKDGWHKWAKILIAIIVFGVCYSRVLLAAHYVSDVLAGVGMALTCFRLAAMLSNIALRRMTRERLNTAAKLWAVVLVGLMVYLVVL
jgi:membrane-associated phospholipid phosphatase